MSDEHLRTIGTWIPRTRGQMEDDRLVALAMKDEAALMAALRRRLCPEQSCDAPPP